MDLRWLAEAGYRSHYRAIERVLEPRRGISRRFLDLGCGTGQFAASFPADRYLGVDPTRPYIAFAGEHRPGQFSVMDGSALGLAAHSFDGALVLGVFIICQTRLCGAAWSNCIMRSARRDIAGDRGCATAKPVECAGTYHALA